MNNRIKNFLSSSISLISKKASRNYIAGPKQDDAQKVSQYLLNRGYWVTQGYWNSRDDKASYVLETYLATLDKLAQLNGNNYISIKIPSLDFDVAMYEALLVKSRHLGVPILFDSLAPEQASRIHNIIKEHTVPPFADIGCTLPARWRRSINDADLMNDLGLNVRVVKGQWEDPDEPCLDVNSRYLQIIDRLAGNSRCVRVATHDLPLAREALSRLKAVNTPCELELIYGLPIGNLVSLANEMNVPVRIYIAFGNAYLPYALTSFRKHPEMIIPFIKEMFKGNYLSSFPVCKTYNSS